MVAVLGFMVSLMAVLLFAKKSATGRMLHEQLVERPLDALTKFERHHLLYAIILVPIFLAGGEAVAILGPEFMAAYALEMAIYFDALVVTYALSALAMMRKGAGFVKIQARAMARLVRPRRKRSQTRSNPLRKPSNDDDPVPYKQVA